MSKGHLFSIKGIYSNGVPFLSKWYTKGYWVGPWGRTSPYRIFQSTPPPTPRTGGGLRVTSQDHDENDDDVHQQTATFDNPFMGIIAYTLKSPDCIQCSMYEPKCIFTESNCHYKQNLLHAHVRLWARRMNQILRCDQLYEWARWHHLACSGLPTVSCEKTVLFVQYKSFIDQAWLVRSRWLDIGLCLFLCLYKMYMRTWPIPNHLVLTLGQ